MRNDLIRAVFGCGMDDLSLLDDAEADMFETVEKLKEEGLEISLMGIIEEIFKEGIFRIGETVKEVRKRLEHGEKSDSLTEEESEQLEAIRTHDLNPQADFQYYLNFLDTHLSCDSEKKEVYEEFFEKEMQDLMDYTGFNIEG